MSGIVTVDSIEAGHALLIAELTARCPGSGDVPLLVDAQIVTAAPGRDQALVGSRVRQIQFARLADSVLGVVAHQLILTFITDDSLHYRG